MQHALRPVALAALLSISGGSAMADQFSMLCAAFANHMADEAKSATLVVQRTDNLLTFAQSDEGSELAILTILVVKIVHAEIAARYRGMQRDIAFVKQVCPG